MVLLFFFFNQFYSCGILRTQFNFSKREGWCCVAVSWLSCHLGCWYSISECQFESWLLCFLTSFLLMCLGRQWKMTTQILGPLPPIWETHMKFLAPCSGLAKSHDCGHLSKSSDGRSHSLPPYLHKHSTQFK